MTGHIHKRVHRCRDGSDSVLWYVVLDIGSGPDGRRRQKWHGGYRTRREAEVRRARLVDAMHSGTYTRPSRLTVAAWVQDNWLPMMETQIKPTTLRGYEQVMRSHVLPVVGQTPIQRLSTWDLDSLYGALLRGAGGPALSLTTVANVHRTIHKALADAVDAGVLEQNVAARAKAPRPHRALDRQVAVWRPEELVAFLRGVRDDRLAAVWRLAALTGMRRGEMLGLHWDDVAFGRACVTVRRALVDVNYLVVESTTKGNRARTIALDPTSVDLLRRHREEQQHERVLWGNAYEDAGLVVAWENGTMIHPHALSRMFAGHVRRLGLRQIRLHDLRHTHATLALHAGVPVTVVAERLGHHSPAFTLQQYGHALPGMQAAAAAAVADLLSATGIP